MTIKKLTAVLLVLAIAMSILIVPAAATGINDGAERAARVCPNCGSGDLSYLGTTYTSCGPDDYGQEHWMIEKEYRCRSCGYRFYTFEGYTSNPPT